MQFHVGLLQHFHWKFTSSPRSIIALFLDNCSKNQILFVIKISGWDAGCSKRLLLLRTSSRIRIFKSPDYRRSGICANPDFYAGVSLLAITVSSTTHTTCDMPAGYHSNSMKLTDFHSLPYYLSKEGLPQLLTDVYSEVRIQIEGVLKECYSQGCKAVLLLNAARRSRIFASQNRAKQLHVQARHSEDLNQVSRREGTIYTDTVCAQAFCKFFEYHGRRTGLDMYMYNFKLLSQRHFFMSLRGCTCLMFTAATLLRCYANIWRRPSIGRGSFRETLCLPHHDGV